MNDLTTREGCMDAGVAAYEKAEVKLRQAQKAILDIVPILQAGNSLTMMGALQANRMVAELKAASGLVASAEAEIWRSHRESTDIVQECGLEVTPLGGGPR